MSVFRKIVLTTREGNDNTTKVFARDLRKLVGDFRAEGLLHWHGLLRVKGGYFPITRRMLGDKWNEVHGAFVVEIKPVDSGKQLKEYILKDIMKQYLGEDEIRNKFLFSRGWMRKGWKEVEGIAKGWVLGGASAILMTKEGWALVNEVMKAWAEKQTIEFLGKEVDGKRVGYLFMELGRISEAVGSAFRPGGYEYYDY